MQVSQLKDYDTHAIIGGSKAKAFRTAESAEFFTILSDTLYSHKKLAVIRETVCNAWDAHIMMGIKDVPVEIEVTDAELVIRDHGPGIPAAQFEDKYCVYGGTDKVEDENQTGGFGLGCKVPFAYSDHFTVENCNNGVRSVYAISRGGSETQGRPDVREMVNAPTADTGITVTVPLHSESDAREFTRIAKEIVRRGGMYAKVNGDLVTGLDYSAARKRGYGVMLSSAANKLGLDDTNNIYCLYGTVVYPVSGSDPRLKKVFDRVSDILAKSRRYGASGAAATLILVAKPGSIGVAPSREGLSYTDRTVGEIRRLLEKFLNEFNSALPATCNALNREAITHGARVTNLTNELWNVPVSNYASRLGKKMAIETHGFETDPVRIQVLMMASSISVYMITSSPPGHEMGKLIADVMTYAPEYKRIARRALNGTRGGGRYLNSPDRRWREAFRTEELRKTWRTLNGLADIEKTAVITHDRDRETADTQRLRRYDGGEIGNLMIISTKRYEATDKIVRRDVVQEYATKRTLRAISVIANTNDPALMAALKKRAETFGFNVVVAEPVASPKSKAPVNTDLRPFADIHSAGWRRRNNPLPGRTLSVADVTHYIYVDGGERLLRYWSDIHYLKSYVIENYGDKIAFVTNKTDLKRVKKAGAKDLSELLADDMRAVLKRKSAALVSLIANNGLIRAARQIARMESVPFDIDEFNASNALDGLFRERPRETLALFGKYLRDKDQAIKDVALLRAWKQAPHAILTDMTVEKERMKKNETEVVKKLIKDRRVRLVLDAMSMVRVYTGDERRMDMAFALIAKAANLNLKGEKE